MDVPFLGEAGLYTGYPPRIGEAPDSVSNAILDFHGSVAVAEVTKGM